MVRHKPLGDDMTSDTKIKKPRAKAKSGDKRKKENRPPLTDKQIAAQFKPGNTAAINAWSMKSETRAFRKRCHDIIHVGGLEPMVTMLTHCANNGMFKEFMELQRFLAEYAYGKPGEMKDVEDTDPNDKPAEQKFTFLNITQDQFKDAVASDEPFN